MIARGNQVDSMGPLAVNKSGRLECLAIPCFIFAVWLVRLYGFYDPPVFFDDARQHLFWRRILIDPEMFPNDPSVAFLKGTVLKFSLYSKSYEWLLEILPLWMIPAIFSCFLIFLSAFLLDKILKIYHVSWQGRLLGCSLLLLVRHDIAEGLQRSFFLPFILLTWFAVLRYKRLVFPVLLIQTVVYPPALVLSLSFIGCNELISFYKNRKVNVLVRNMALLFVVAALLGGGLYVQEKKFRSNEYGSLVDAQTAQAMPEFNEGGRHQFWSDSFIETYIAGSGRGDLALDLVLPLFLILIPVLYFKRQWKVDFPQEFLALLSASLGMFFLAHLTLFLFYLPNRYVGCTLPLLVIVWTALCFSREKYSSRYIFRYLGVFLSVVVIGWFSVAPVTIPEKLNRDERLLFEFLSSTPKDSLVAGEPYLMNQVPLFSGRSVLANVETTLAWRIVYYDKMLPRLKDSLLIAYSSDVDAVRSCLKDQGVDYVVVSPGIQNGDIRYPRPWDAYAESVRTGGPSAVCDGLVGQEVFHSGGYRVFRIPAES